MSLPSLDVLSRAWRAVVMADRDGTGASPQALRMHDAVARELRVAGAWAYDAVGNIGIADWLRSMSSDLSVVKAYLAGIDASLRDAATGLSVAQLLAADRFVTTVYDSAADVVLPAGGGYTWLTPWLDVERYSRIGAFIWNNAGTNPIGGVPVYWAPNADGSGAPGAVAVPGVNVGATINNNAAYYLPLNTLSSGISSPTSEQRGKYRGVRLAGWSTIGMVGGGARVTVLASVGR